MQITINKQESDVLLALLDLAVKSGGLQVAENCLYFSKKFKYENEQSVQGEGKPASEEGKDAGQNA